MHPISDKELDKVFQQRFEDVEFQPSEGVWGKIAARMDQKEKVNKPFPVFWMAAASVVIILGASLWFYRPVKMIKLQGTDQNLVHNSPVSPISDLGTGAATLDPHQPEIKGFDFSKLASSEQKTFNTVQEETGTNESAVELPRQDVMASTNSSKRINLETVQPIKEVKVPRYGGDQSQLDVTQPDMIASAPVVQNDLLVDQEQIAQKRIRSVGSLVNFVISKVDRRDDKIIEFKDGDEGSEISGINLGLIKLKSRIK